MNLSIRRGVITHVPLQIGTDCAGNVSLQVLLIALLGFHQLKAAVKDHQRLAAGLQVMELFNGDKGGVHGGFLMCA
jgi:hypothetical protein